MLVVDTKGNLFDERRKEDRRKEKVKVDEDRRTNQRRTLNENKKHE